MPITPTETTTTMSPNLVDVVRSTKALSAADRLFLAKILLDSLVLEEAITGTEQKNNGADLFPTVEEVVAQIKAMPANPQQIQRTAKTIDEVIADWGENPVDEVQLTTDEDEWPTCEEIVNQIQAMAAEPDAFHPATKSIEMWLAEQTINPPTPSSLSPDEWEQLWTKFERELKASEQATGVSRFVDCRRGASLPADSAND